MKILFLGDASAVHYNLSLGLRAMGHEAIVISGKIGWRDFPQDILLDRAKGKIGAIRYLIRVLSILPKLKGYDIVQIVGPHFLELKSERLWKIYDYLRRNNKCIIRTMLGEDYYWVAGCCEKRLFRYGDFNIGEKDLRLSDAYAKKVYDDWTLPLHRSYTEHIAQTSNGIVTVLYEYWKCYQAYWPKKTIFIPLPIIMPNNINTNCPANKKIKIFIGIQKERSHYKGTDIMLQAAQDIIHNYPDDTELQVVENVPYKEYLQIMEGSDIILDQLYSYTPSMNSLLAMSKGIICVGGGEPENYEIINETELRPIVNVQPNYESVYEALQQLIKNKERIPELKRQSVEYVRRHHDHMKVAKEYASYYKQLLDENKH